MLTLIGFLIIFPLIIAALLAVVKQDKTRSIIVGIGAAAIILGSLVTVAKGLNNYEYFVFSSEIINIIGCLIGVIVAAIIIWQSIKYKNLLAGALAVIQLIGSLIFELVIAQGIEVQNGIYYDSLSILMVFIIGVIGSSICIYAVGYMQDYQQHASEDEPDRRPIFFALMFVFLSAMFVIVLTNNMTWMFTGWEVTTLCSFLLIGYTKTDEAINNAFRQIIMNLLGGLGFLVALILSAITLGTLDFNEFVSSSVTSPSLMCVAVVALAFAGLTKAAQMPFHTWLLGAMVAPTPTSALLHSSTMVKAGVFLLVKLAPAFMVSVVPGVLVTVVGGFTFLMCSFMAISQSNAKRVLAYSTIANLGLIAACAGIGTPEAVWAACFLILFHAVAKSLLFLCVGTAEHHIGSRDIESMDLLFERMPRLARFMILGIMTMFVAPFGMLISKWGALVSFVDTGQILIILALAFGSAATFMFWAKWLGKLSGIAGEPENVETTVHKSEWIPLSIMAGLIVIFCVGLPILSRVIVMPYLTQAYEVFGALSGMLLVSFGNIPSDDNLIVVSILVVITLAFIGIAFKKKQKSKKVNIYLAGVSIENDSRSFKNSLSGETEAISRNWYMEDIFGEMKLNSFATVFAISVIVIAFVIGILVCAGLLVL